VLEDFCYAVEAVKDLNSEYEEPPWDLIFDISDADVGVSIKSGTCSTRCRWSNRPEDDNPDKLQGA